MHRGALLHPQQQQHLLLLVLLVVAAGSGGLGSRCRGAVPANAPRRQVVVVAQLGPALNPLTWCRVAVTVVTPVTQRSVRVTSSVLTQPGG